MPINKKRRSWNRLKDLYFIWLLRRRYRWWRKEIPRREQVAEPLGIWLYLVKKFIIERTQYFTPANVMSLCRGLLSYPMFLLLIEGYTLAAVFVFTVALLTDFFDGHLARAFNQETPSGKLADPLCDKVLIVTALLALVKLETIPPWLVSLMIGLDGLLVIMAVILKPLASALGIERQAGANEYGKWKLVGQSVALSCFFMSLLLNHIDTLSHVMNWAGIITGISAVIFAAGSISEHAFPGCLKGSPDNLVRSAIVSWRSSSLKTNA